MVIFLLQNGLVSRASHFYSESLAWRAAWHERGLGRDLRSPQSRARGSGSAGRARLLPRQPDATFTRDGVDRLRPLDAMAQMFAETCAVLDHDGAGPGDTVIVPYARIPEIEGLARWLETRPAETRSFVAAIIHRPEKGWQIDPDRHRVTGDPSGFRAALDRLGAAAGPAGYLVAANNEPLARILAGATGHDIPVVPLAFTHRAQRRWYADHDSPDGLSFRGRRFDLGLLGQFRDEKGGMVAVAALRRVLERRPGASLAIQLSDQDQARRVAAMLAGTGRRAPACWSAT